MIGHTISLFPGRIQAYYRSHRTGHNSAQKIAEKMILPTKKVAKYR